MITPSTKSIALGLFWGCAAISGGHGLWELLTGQWLESSLHLAGAGFVLFMGWCIAAAGGMGSGVAAGSGGQGMFRGIAPGEDAGHRRDGDSDRGGGDRGETRDQTLKISTRRGTPGSFTVRATAGAERGAV